MKHVLQGLFALIEQLRLIGVFDERAAVFIKFYFECNVGGAEVFLTRPAIADVPESSVLLTYKRGLGGEGSVISEVVEKSSTARDRIRRAPFSLIWRPTGAVR